MKFQLIIVCFIVGVLSSCEGVGGDAGVLVAEPVESTLIEVIDNFRIKLPNYFVEMSDINPKASLQYGFIANSDALNHENDDEFFVTILALKKTDIVQSLLDSGLVTIDKMNLKTAINLDLILEGFKATTAYPETELINGIVALRNEFSGRLGIYDVFYKMAIFETEQYFFQLLTWCMQKHANKHKNEMDSMILSFENKK